MSNKPKDHKETEEGQFKNILPLDLRASTEIQLQQQDQYQEQQLGLELGSEQGQLWGQLAIARPPLLHWQSQQHLSVEQDQLQQYQLSHQQPHQFQQQFQQKRQISLYKQYQKQQVVQQQQQLQKQQSVEQGGLKLAQHEFDEGRAILASPRSQRKKEGQSLGIAQEIEKKRIRWTPSLHSKFVAVVDSLGGPRKATPKMIQQGMAEQCLTIFHIKSHLQKFRSQYRGLGCEGNSDGKQKKSVHAEGVQIATTTSTEPEQGSVLCLPLTRSSSRDVFETLGIPPLSTNTHIMHHLDSFIQKQNKFGQVLQQQLMQQYHVKRELEISGQQLSQYFGLVKEQSIPPQQIFQSLYQPRVQADSQRERDEKDDQETAENFQQEELQQQQQQQLQQSLYQHQSQQQQQQHTSQYQQFYFQYAGQLLKYQKQQQPPSTPY